MDTEAVRALRARLSTHREGFDPRNHFDPKTHAAQSVPAHAATLALSGETLARLVLAVVAERADTDPEDSPSGPAHSALVRGTADFLDLRGWKWRELSSADRFCPQRAPRAADVLRVLDYALAHGADIRPWYELLEWSPVGETEARARADVCDREHLQHLLAYACAVAVVAEATDSATRIFGGVRQPLREMLAHWCTCLKDTTEPQRACAPYVPWDALRLHAETYTRAREHARHATDAEHALLALHAETYDELKTLLPMLETAEGASAQDAPLAAHAARRMDTCATRKAPTPHETTRGNPP